ncbi:MAG: hypothetical protein JNJ45_04920 [Chthonomonas sp.]|nr:hypothetical protein [Chthonomonas sp.]
MKSIEIGNKLVELCRGANWADAYTELFVAEPESVEAMGEDRVAKGMAAIRGKMEWWDSTFDVKKMEVEGPFPHGESEFGVIFRLDTVNKQTGEENHMDELALYELDADGKITRERFFYGA